jgi:protein subunit release factor A
MQKVYIQIRRGEGGKDSSLLVEDMANMYIKAAKINNLNYSVVQNRDGMVVL